MRLHSAVLWSSRDHKENENWGSLIRALCIYCIFFCTTVVFCVVLVRRPVRWCWVTHSGLERAQRRSSCSRNSWTRALSAQTWQGNLMAKPGASGYPADQNTGPFVSQIRTLSLNPDRPPIIDDCIAELANRPRAENRYGNGPSN